MKNIIPFFRNGFSGIDRIEIFLLILAGLLTGISFPPFPLYFLGFISLIPLFYVLERRNGLASINRAMYLFALVFNIVTLYWVGSWTDEADPFLKISGVLLVFFNPLLFLIPSTLYHIVKTYTGKKYALWFLPVFWAAYEYLYTITEFRFPWLTLGNGQAYFNQFIQIADITGVYGITLIIVFTNVFFYKAYNNYRNNKKYPGYAVAGLMLIIIPVLYGVTGDYDYNSENVPVKIGVVQPNLNPWNKWETGNLEEQLELYLALSDSCINEGAEIVIWPETALPVYLLSGSYERKVRRIHEYVNNRNVPILTGMPHANIYRNKEDAPPEAKPFKMSEELYTSYNSMVMFEPGNNNVQQYGKIKLVPFGEKVPYVESLPWLGDLLKWEVGISSWNTGTDTLVFHAKSGKGKNLNIGGIICIESIYPDFTAQFVQRGAGFITVVTNDSWYGYSSGPFQHKAIANLRAIENRRFVIRCANGGISCIIDPAGNTVKQTELFTRTYMTGYVYPLYDLTFYSRFPLLIPGLTTVITLFFFLLAVVKKTKFLLFDKKK